MTIRPPVRAAPADPRAVEAHERIARENRPDGPHNARPIARPSQGPSGFSPPRNGAPNAAAGQGGEGAPVDLRARAAAAVALQSANTRPPVEAPDPGKVLASVPRPDGTQLRVSLHTYEGKPYVRVAPWSTRDGGATWWPVKGKGASVKVRELGAVAAGLLDALDAASANDDGARRP